MWVLIMRFYQTSTLTKFEHSNISSLIRGDQQLVVGEGRDSSYFGASQIISLFFAKCENCLFVSVGE